MEIKEINSKVDFQGIKFKDTFSLGQSCWIALSNSLMDSNGDYYVQAQAFNTPQAEGCLGNLKPEKVMIKDTELAFWKEKSHV